MTASAVQFLVSAGFIVAAGAALAQFADVISNKTKLGRMLVGTLLLAGATSLPELSIGISFVRMGSPDLAVGDLLGACLFNLLILAVFDMTRYSKGQMLSRGSAAHALPAGMSVVMLALAAIAMFLGDKLGSFTIAGAGPGSLAVAAAYAAGVGLIYTGRKEASNETANVDGVSWIPGVNKIGLGGAAIGFAVTAVVILLAAPFLGKAAKDLAEATGLGGTFFGTVFVAVCTCLPELITTFAAVRMKAFELAIGNIFGSNCFNIFLLFPLDFFYRGSLLASVSPTHMLTALCAILVTSVVILGQLYQVERKRHFLEPDALIVIALVLSSLAGVYSLR
jgi:cation:H+ antiporter